MSSHGSPSSDVVTHGDQDLLTSACAARLITALSDLQASKGTASLVLTGGGAGIEVLRKLRAAPARDAIDFTRLDVYWGDERFVPSGDEHRNDAQARRALLDHVPIEEDRVFVMPSSDGVYGADPEAAARSYARTLAEQASSGADSPAFDITLLGLGPEGHTASIFPGTEYALDRQHTVLAVRDCPKPPPTRISLSLPTIRRSGEVWLIAAGAEKADAVALAHGGAVETDLPVAGARGVHRTLWLLDTAAAARLPEA